MTPDEQLIHTFYTAFRHRDFSTMQSCYADHATFSDPVFPNLNAAQVRSMSEMFLDKNKSLAVEYDNVQLESGLVVANWTADYVLSSTGNRVSNCISSQFIIESGKIIEQTDHFGFYRWSRQALGMTGVMLGWTPFIKRNVRHSAMAALQEYIRHQA